MKLCYFGTYHRVDSHNDVVLSSLRADGVEVEQCHYDLWRDQTVLTPARGWLPIPRIIRRLCLGTISLSFTYMRMSSHDAVMTGVIGHADFLLAWLLTRYTRTPLVFNAFISLYQTMVDDRQLLSRSSLRARILKRVDRFCCRHADVVFLDTQEHIEYFTHELGLDDVEFTRLWIGAPAVFQRTVKEVTDAPPAVSRTVLFYGQYIPLQGAENIVDAATHLRDTDIQFIMVGHGQNAGACYDRARDRGLTRMKWITWLEPEELRKEICAADILLGIFGDTRKASMVIPNKVYAGMAMGKPLITRDSPAVRELLKPGEECRVVPPDDGEALARAIVELYDNPDEMRRMGIRACKRFHSECDFATIGSVIRARISDVIQHTNNSD